MNNLFREGGERIELPPASEKPALGRTIQADAIKLGAQYAIPFSSFHRYQREDSVWANRLSAPMENYQADQRPEGPQVLPAFVQVDAVTGACKEIKPRSLGPQVRKAEEFGDNWAYQLTAEEN